MKTPVLLIVIVFTLGMALSAFSQNKSTPPYAQSNDVQNTVMKVDPNATHNDIKMDPISNYPDPFTRETTIEFTIWAPTKVSLIIYYETGERVAVLVGQLMQVGNHRVIWDSGKLRPGKYFALLQMGQYSIREEMTKVYDIHSGLPVWY
jgi:hypothetical protein